MVVICAHAHTQRLMSLYITCYITVQVYLVDYGLAYRYLADGAQKPYKEDPKRTHDGTIEFTSRDAHRGVGKRIFLCIVKYVIAAIISVMKGDL